MHPPPLSHDPNAVSAEHPLDVLRFAISQIQQGKKCALAMLTDTVGGAVRARGAIMAISENGNRCGYLSGGCVDADIVAQAQAALQNNQHKTLRYGQGSPFIDIVLPCGGAIEVTIFAAPSLSHMTEVAGQLEARSTAKLNMRDETRTITVDYFPKLRVRIAGRSADPIALARACIAAGIETELWSADGDVLSIAASMPNLQTLALDTPSSLPPTHDDPQTAFVLMMHDNEWEMALLQQALAGPAFYIGAVGSPMTHKTRCQALRSVGVPQTDIERIHGPIGLVPSLRDASMLAISTLAEIINMFPNAHSVFIAAKKEHTHV